MKNITDIYEEVVNEANIDLSKYKDPKKLRQLIFDRYSNVLVNGGDTKQYFSALKLIKQLAKLEKSDPEKLEKEMIKQAQKQTD